MEFGKSSLESMALKFKGKNILVTGGTGFIGSHLVEELVNQGAHIIVTSLGQDPSSYFFKQNLNKKCIVERVDLSNFEEVFRVTAKHQVEIIFHLGAQALVEVAYYNPRDTFQSNITGTVNILESARLLPHVKVVINASSDKAYGKLEKGKYKEGNGLQGDHPYDVSKSAADLIANSYHKTYGIPVVTTRFGNVYGEGDLNESRIIPGIMKSIVKKEQLIIRSNGKYIRDYLYVKDVVSGYLLLAQNSNKVTGEAYNFGSNESFSVLEVIKVIEKTLGKKINYIIKNSAKNEIPYQSLDFTKIKKQLGWKPEFTMQKIAQHILEWYQDYFEE